MVKKLIRFISPEEFKKILIAEKDRSFKLAYLLAFGSGLRISEIVGLKNEVSDCCNSSMIENKKIVNGNKRKVYLCSQCNKEVSFKNFKRGSDWKIKPLEKEQIDLNSKQIKVLGKGNKERITLINPDFPIKEYMVTLLPLNINRRTLENRFKKLCNKVIGKPLNFHTLRHGFANYMLNVKGYPMPIIQGFGGWVRLDTIGIYARSNPQLDINKIWGIN